MRQEIEDLKMFKLELDKKQKKPPRAPKEKKVIKGVKVEKKEEEDGGWGGVEKKEEEGGVVEKKKRDKEENEGGGGGEEEEEEDNPYADDFADYEDDFADEDEEGGEEEEEEQVAKEANEGDEDDDLSLLSDGVQGIDFVNEKEVVGDRSNEYVPGLDQINQVALGVRSGGDNVGHQGIPMSFVLGGDDMEDDGEGWTMEEVERKPLPSGDFLSELAQLKADAQALNAAYAKKGM